MYKRQDENHVEKTLPDKWALLQKSERAGFEHELHHEMCEGHILYKCPLAAVARWGSRDDFLFIELQGAKDLAQNHCHIVHLTWSKETKPDYPWVVSFTDYADFVRNWRKMFD